MITNPRAASRAGRLVLGMVALAGLMVSATAQTTVRASLSDTGSQINGISPQGTISGNGRYIVFTSFGTNVTMLQLEQPLDAPVTQVYLRDLQSNTTVLISVNAFGFAANGNCHNPRISPDGRFISYSSDATNLDGVDNNGSRDIFRRDTVAGTTIRVSVADDEAEGNTTSDSSAISADGNLIAFRSHATNLVPGGTQFSQVFLRNVSAGTTSLVSVSATGSALPYGDNDSGGFQPSITPNGRFIGFTTKAGNLVAGDTNGNWDVYLRDMQLGVTKRVSLPSNGAQYFGMSHTSAVSDDGNFVAFGSLNAFNIADTNGVFDVFLKNLTTNTLIRISNNTKGKAPNGASGDSEGWGIRISGDGNRIAYESMASDLVKTDANGVEDVFFYDRNAGTTKMVSVTSAGAAGNGASNSPTISSNGYIAFVSDATNIVPLDTNGCTDVFRRGIY